MKSFSIITRLAVVFLLYSCADSTKKTTENQSVTVVKNLIGKEIRSDSIDAYIKSQMTKMQVPGVSFAIINDGKLAYHQVYGLANMASQKPVAHSTLFEGASTSKPVFAYMTMFLVEDGQLDLDTPLVNYLAREYQSNYNFDERYARITPRMVLSHTTGFPNWRDNGDLTIGFDPGTNFSYSGEGYQFLVRTLESILETDYNGLEEYYQKKVAEPLGMTHTKYVQDKYNRTHKAIPHKEGKPMAINLWMAEEFNAASALHTEAAEFSKWIIALFEENGLSGASLDKLFTDQISVDQAPGLFSEEGAIGWTLGFAKYDLNDHVVYGHEGNNDGFNALFLLDREKKWAMIQFNNANEVYDFGFDLFGYLHK